MSGSNEDKQQQLKDQLEACHLVQRFCELQRVELEQVHTFLQLRGSGQALVEMRHLSHAFREQHEELKRLQQEHRRMMHRN